MKKICNYDNSKVFEMFNDNLYIPADETGKNTHTYIDSEKIYKVIDYLGNENIEASSTSVHLEKADYTLSISEIYMKFYKLLQEGYLFKGVEKNG